MLCYPEGRAALAGAHRGRRLSATGYGRAREEFESLQSELVLVGIDGPLARWAGELAEEHKLRGYDAVHLASALALGADTTLVTWDEDLKHAAARGGCAVAPAD
jgi:predicted nucleic acid-binding protein